MNQDLLNSQRNFQSINYIYPKNTGKIQRLIVVTAIFNLLIVSVLGLALRAYPLFSISFPSFKNLLHAHSHFAFGGWVMPVLFAMILKYFPEIADRISYRHLKNISLLMFVSSYGMLLCFPFQGYAFASISFSTLSILAGFYQAVIFWNASKEYKDQTAVRFLRAGLVYLTISAIGPFATAPLIATGNAGTPLYFNSIYFFLHFQYNGWFSFAILAILYKIIYPGNGAMGRKVFILINISCVPTYFLSTLWSHPNSVFYFIGGFAALLQLVAVYFMARDFMQLKSKTLFSNPLLQIALVLFVFKTILQLISSIPALADLAYQQRNFTIAYLHMVLLGFVTLFIFGLIIERNELVNNFSLRNGMILFILCFILTETLLIINASGYNIALGPLKFPELIFLGSVLLPVSLAVLWKQVKYGAAGV